MRARDTKAKGRTWGSTSPPRPYAGAYTSHTARILRHAHFIKYPWVYQARNGLCVAFGGVGKISLRRFCCLGGKTQDGSGFSTPSPPSTTPLLGGTAEKTKENPVMKKRLSACALALCMACVLCACGGGSDTPAPPVEPTPPPVQNVTPPAENSPSDVSEPDSSYVEVPPEPEPEKLEGLIFVNQSTSSTNPYISREVYCFNPETGTETLVSKFTFLSRSANEDYYMDNSFILAPNQYMFSSDYSKMAITKYFANNGEAHAGWLDTNGVFFDVTEKLGQNSKSDFEDTVHYKADGFSDEWFCFANYDIDSNHPNHYHIAIDDIICTAIQEGDIIPSNDQSGNLLEIVPGNSRDNWNGVVSPDGTSIAFMSTPKGVSSPITDIYIIPTDGGDPTKVTGYSIKMSTYLGGMNSSGTEGYLLIDWI